MIKCINIETVSNAAQLPPLFIQPPQDVLEPGPRGINMRVLVKSSQTNYHFSCVELVLAPKKMGPAPHIHDHLDEFSCVLEGTLGVLAGDEIQEIKAGGFSSRPRGIVHSFWNPSDEPLHFFELDFSQNFDEYLEDLFFNRIAYMTKHNLKPDDPFISKWAKDLHEEFGLTFFPEKGREIIERFGLTA